MRCGGWGGEVWRMGRLAGRPYRDTIAGPMSAVTPEQTRKKTRKGERWGGSGSTGEVSGLVGQR